MPHRLFCNGHFRFNTCALGSTPQPAFLVSRACRQSVYACHISKHDLPELMHCHLKRACAICRTRSTSPPRLKARGAMTLRERLFADDIPYHRGPRRQVSAAHSRPLDPPPALPPRVEDPLRRPSSHSGWDVPPRFADEHRSGDWREGGARRSSGHLEDGALREGPPAGPRLPPGDYRLPPPRRSGTSPILHGLTPCKL